MASRPNQSFIDNQRVDGASRKTWSVVNPATGETLVNVAPAEAANEYCRTKVILYSMSTEKTAWPEREDVGIEK